jgi:hypothetical protein
MKTYAGAFLTWHWLELGGELQALAALAPEKEPLWVDGLDTVVAKINILVKITSARSLPRTK